jgi:hypothetical protein
LAADRADRLNPGAAMRTYRFYFYEDHIVGRFDFEADYDDRAEEIAEILFEACEDSCSSWEIWDGAVFIARGPQRPTSASLRVPELIEQRQENIIQYEEAIQTSKWAIASSQRLLAELDNLKASKRGPSLYSILS